ncbi:MAG: PP2C family protein-serine/threonine phosphatase [Phycisphaerae bacterium]|nr:PP2C family protein-serine/threonine phosphatase [Phycisphaerae bacterium]
MERQKAMMDTSVQERNGNGRVCGLRARFADCYLDTTQSLDDRFIRISPELFVALSDRILQVHEDLRQARNQLASYAETLVSIQRAMLPKRLPEIPGLDLAVHFAGVEGVGGDFYDVRPVGHNRWAIVIADAVGHGLAAAAILALVHALGNAVEGQTSPGTALALINQPLVTRYLSNTGQFVTAFVGLYDSESQMLTYTSAGHPPPRLVRGSEVMRLDAVSGLPLGIEEKAEYGEASVQFLPGDRLVLFTDGITESANPAHDLFGDARLDAVLCNPTNTAAELLGFIVHSVREFREWRPAGDDETCLVAVVRPIEATVQAKVRS